MTKGAAGIIAVGLFADDTIISGYYSHRDYAADCGGLLYVVRCALVVPRALSSCLVQGNPYLLLMQMLGLVAVLAWVGIIASLMFYTIHRQYQTANIHRLYIATLH